MTQEIEKVKVDGVVRVFDRVALRHPRMIEFPVPSTAREFTPLEERVMKRGWRYWYLRQPWLDQGREGACVGFGIAHGLNAGPFTRKPLLQNADAQQLYIIGKRHDEWTGEEYDGTSVNGGMLAARELGYVSRFEWSFDESNTMTTLLLDGPVVAGVDWTENMLRPDANGFIKATGRFVGGHCVLLVGVNVKKGFVVVRNSWGIGWGRSGECKLSLDDLAKLHQGIRYPGDFALMTESQRQ